MLLAHILGMPIEELLVPWASGGVGAGVLLVLASVVSRMRRRRSPRGSRQA
jgi:hypothetical protein